LAPKFPIDARESELSELIVFTSLPTQGGLIKLLSSDSTLLETKMEDEKLRISSLFPGGVTFLLQNRHIRRASIIAGTLYAGLQFLQGH
jgi:hypothetical protein